MKSWDAANKNDFRRQCQNLNNDKMIDAKQSKMPRKKSNSCQSAISLHSKKALKSQVEDQFEIDLLLEKLDSQKEKYESIIKDLQE